MNNKEIEKLAEKLERCRKISLDEVNQDEVDEITDIKIDKRKLKNNLNKKQTKPPMIAWRMYLKIYIDSQVYKIKISTFVKK